MTFKGMLKILVNDYKKQHEEKMFTITNELLKARRELKEVKEQLRLLQTGFDSSSNTENQNGPTISLFVQYHGFFHELLEINQTMTVSQLLVKVRHLTGIPLKHPVRIRVLSEDGTKTLFYLDQELDRTIESYKNDLKPRMILSIEESEEIFRPRRSQQFQRSKSLNSIRTQSQSQSHESAV